VYMKDVNKTKEPPNESWQAASDWIKKRWEKRETEFDFFFYTSSDLLSNLWVLSLLKRYNEWSNRVFCITHLLQLINFFSISVERLGRARH
jgi:hypothetical protein